MGVTQSEMAMLLQISRAQWSMYESGKRNLPSSALALLAKIALCIQNTVADDNKTLPSVMKEEGKKKVLLQAMLKENQYQQLYISRKIDAAVKKNQSHIRSLQLINFLKTTQEISEQRLSFLTIIEFKAEKGIRINGTALTKLKIRQTLLQQEELILKAALD